MQILFKPSDKQWEVQEGNNLLQAAEKAGVLINASCAGAGICGNCKVRVISGNPGLPGKGEMDFLSKWEVEEGYRLACMVQPEENMIVEIPDLHGSSLRKKDMVRMPPDFVPEMTVQKLHVKVPKASMKNQKNDITRILEVAGREDLKIERRLLPKVHALLDRSKGDVTLVIKGDRLLALEPGNTEDVCYGAAFDIGTTTIVGMLWDLKTSRLVDVAARTNPQSVYGADVISRIQFCSQEEGNLNLMQHKVIDCFNDILKEFSAKNGLNAETVYDITVVGNTTMSHLFIGVDPKPLARTPFAPVYCMPVDTPAGDLGVQANELASVHLLPNIAGHVGSDIVGVMLTLGINRLAGCTIAIDIGTNGEVVLAREGVLAACSTAAGPALEGAAIFQGMRASRGAIEEVRINGSSVSLKVIDDAEPMGICGSGLIDAVAQMLDAQLIDDSGRMLERHEAEEKGIHRELCQRLMLRDEITEFVLAYKQKGEHIVLTQQDIREVQLAKGAILAGIRTLMKWMDVSTEDVDRIIIAGAFGNYIKKESAMRIGLLPQVSLEKITFCGNGAGAGASMALLSNSARRHGDILARQTKHIELSMNPEFQEEFMQAMSFSPA